jgi:hypothetical protein|tara:strand:- start:20894 stop:21208 length:315 start_codon:yes stop_codon:yes gene_type:complete
LAVSGEGDLFIELKYISFIEVHTTRTITVLHHKELPSVKSSYDIHLLSQILLLKVWNRHVGTTKSSQVASRATAHGTRDGDRGADAVRVPASPRVAHATLGAFR